jgi:hypothetical protein
LARVSSPQILPINQESIRGPAMTLLKLLLLQKAAQMRAIFDGAEGARPTQNAGSQSPNLYDEMLEMCIQACNA